MKKLCTVTALILINAVLLSLTVECLLNLFSFSMAISIDTPLEAPTSLPLILALTAVALLLLVGTFLARLKLSDRFHFTEKSLYLQYALAFLLSVPLIKLWEMLFDLLKITC
jgi:hypothetical protein